METGARLATRCASDHESFRQRRMLRLGLSDVEPLDARVLRPRGRRDSSVGSRIADHHAMAARNLR
jgi:hypothetical protein